MKVNPIKYPMLSKVLAAEEVEAGWKESLLGILLSLGIGSTSFANTNDFHKALKGLDHKKIGAVQIEVLKNSGGYVDVKVGDYSVRGTAVGAQGNVSADLSVYGPKDGGGKGYQEANFLMEKMSESEELRK